MGGPLGFACFWFATPKLLLCTEVSLCRFKTKSLRYLCRFVRSIVQELFVKTSPCVLVYEGVTLDSRSHLPIARVDCLVRSV